MEVNIESSPKTMLSLRPSDRPWKRSDRSWESKEHGPCLPTTIVEAVPLCFLSYAGVSLPKRTGGVGHRTSYIKTTRKYEHAIKSRSELFVNECILQGRSVALDIGLKPRLCVAEMGSLRSFLFLALDNKEVYSYAMPMFFYDDHFQSRNMRSLKSFLHDEFSNCSHHFNNARCFWTALSGQQIL
jgi:hypothetical protein